MSISFYPLASIALLETLPRSTTLKGVWNGINVHLTEIKLNEDSQIRIANLTKLQHSNIARFFGVCKSDNGAVMSIFEDLPMNLLSILAKFDFDLPWISLSNIMLDISKGLHFLHQNNVVHGDLRSENILLDKELRAKITNFQFNNPSTSARWTPPELLLDRTRVTKNSDIYNLGIILWEVSDRKNPCAGGRSDEEISEGRQQEISSSCPQEISRIIQHCCNLNPSERPDSSLITERLSEYQRALMSTFSLQFTAKYEEDEEPTPGKPEYENGRRFWEIGKTEGIVHFLQAAEKGNKNAYLRLDQSVVETALRENYVARIRLSWYERKAKYGDPHAYYNLALCHEVGYGGVRDRKKALELYLKCAEMGYVRGFYAAGNVYRDDGVYDKALECYRAAEKFGMLLAFTSLGYCHENALGVAKNEKLAAEYYTIAAEGGEVNAQYNLAICYFYGQGVARNVQKAVYWYEKAADLGEPEACYYLGLFYKNGVHVKQDKKRARELLNNAAKRGQHQAIEAIVEL